MYKKIKAETTDTGRRWVLEAIVTPLKVGDVAQLRNIDPFDDPRDWGMSASEFSRTLKSMKTGKNLLSLPRPQIPIIMT